MERLARLGYDLQEYTVKAEEVEIQESRENFPVEPATLFIDWAYALELVEIYRQRLGLAEEQLAMTNRMYRANLVEKLEVIIEYYSSPSHRRSELLSANGKEQVAAERELIRTEIRRLEKEIETLEKTVETNVRSLLIQAAELEKIIELNKELIVSAEEKASEEARLVDSFARYHRLIVQLLLRDQGPEQIRSNGPVPLSDAFQKAVGHSADLIVDYQLLNALGGFEVQHARAGNHVDPLDPGQQGAHPRFQPALGI